MKRAITNTAEELHAYRAMIALAILGASAICAVFYACNLYAMISRTVALKHAESALTAASTEVGKLDAEYLKLAASVTPDSLAAHGFAEGKVSLYIARTVATASLPALAQGGHEF